MTSVSGSWVIMPTLQSNVIHNLIFKNFSFQLDYTNTRNKLVVATTVRLVSTAQIIRRAQKSERIFTY